jgi:hypothetical protein
MIPTTTVPAPTTLTPPFDFSPSKPVIPTPTIIATPAPQISPAFAPLPTIVFPSGGSTRPPVNLPPSSNWLDQQMIAGFPNKYLALATIGGVFLLSMASAKRRR